MPANTDLVFAAGSMESSISFWRRSSTSAIRGNADRRRTRNTTPNTMRVQIISPTLGWTRKLPPLAAMGVIGDIAA